MDYSFVLLVDGPLEGQIVSIFQGQQFFDVAALDSNRSVRYKIECYFLLEDGYLIGAVDTDSAIGKDLSTIIKAANHHPFYRPFYAATRMPPSTIP